MIKKSIIADLEAIGSRLKAVRVHLNLKQRKFAEILNTSVVNLSEIERGRKKPGVELLIYLSRQYRVNLTYLLHGEGDMFRPEKVTKGVTIEDGLFGHYTEEVKEMLWLMQNSLMARGAIIAMAKEYFYRNEDLLEKDIQRQKLKSEKK
ncbi:MAG: helix-turn-helix transcriptional regulator [Candidatus Aminicenantes bacterium]|nr:MAG: helix-turn-helix transcriptional regulator [Candidatus Aminicenantes bacterium]